MTSTATIADPKRAARSAGLRYVSDAEPGIARQRAGAGFIYVRPDGGKISEPTTRKRIRSLVIPPAWTDVWICPSPDGHIQATGRDARGRKQYCYHPLFRELRESTKYERVIGFAETLPTIRAKVREHMALRGLPREKVIATVVHLLETTLIRIGNDDYARQNRSYGLTTLKNHHVAVDGAEARFRFTGKGGKQWSLAVRDRRVARIIKGCQDLPGQDLLQYIDDDGECQSVTSNDVNAYLKEVTGQDITAKDFRTWAGTVMAALALDACADVTSETAAKKSLRAAIAQVAARLGNTPTICRKCYIHPAVVEAYLDGNLDLKLNPHRRRRSEAFTGLQREETAVLKLLRGRLTRRTARNSRGRSRVSGVARLSEGGSHENSSPTQAVASSHRAAAASVAVGGR
jgi:DNA topoisomerase-1